MALNPAVPNETRALGDNVIATAETFLADEYIDVVFEPSPLLGGAFRAAKMPGTPKSAQTFPFGKAEIMRQDGREAWLPAGYGTSSNTQAFSRGSTLSLNIDDVGTTQRCDFANYTDAAAIYKVEQWENRGPVQRLNIYKERGKMALRTTSARIEGDLWSANADTSGAQEEVVGLQTLISTGTTNTAWKLSRSTYTFQRNNTTVIANTFANVGLSSMRSMWTSCSGNGGFDKPTCIGTTAVLFNAYEAEAEDIHRITVNLTADLGMETVMYKGVPMFWSDNCLTGAIYMFNLNYSKVMLPLGQEWETQHYGPENFPNAPVGEAIRYFIRMNWGFSRYDRQGVISGFTDT
jgi:hypothetical protein